MGENSLGSFSGSATQRSVTRLGGQVSLNASLSFLLGLGTSGGLVSLVAANWGGSSLSSFGSSGSLTDAFQVGHAAMAGSLPEISR